MHNEQHLIIGPNIAHHLLKMNGNMTLHGKLAAVLSFLFCFRICLISFKQTLNPPLIQFYSIQLHLTKIRWYDTRYDFHPIFIQLVACDIFVVPCVTGNMIIIITLLVQHCLVEVENAIKLHKIYAYEKKGLKKINFDSFYDDKLIDKDIYPKCQTVPY